MAHWKSVIGKLASNTDDHFDELLMQYRRRTGRLKPVQIVPYRGFGNVHCATNALRQVPAVKWWETGR